MPPILKVQLQFKTTPYTPQFEEKKMRRDLGMLYQSVIVKINM